MNIDKTEQKTDLWVFVF